MTKISKRATSKPHMINADCTDNICAGVMDFGNILSWARTRLIHGHGRRVSGAAFFQRTDADTYTGNGWAAAGMLRVHATLQKADQEMRSRFRSQLTDLGIWALEIIKAAAEHVVSSHIVFW